MNTLFQPFDFQRVFVLPWTDNLPVYGWIFLMGFFVATACGLVGNFLILRRMALVGDAISHSILPGLVVAFLLARSRNSGVMFLGALAAGMLTTVLIELIHNKSRVKQDAAIGITFSSLFAIGVILISLYASRVDLDQDCVLYGEISNVALEPLVHIGTIAIAPESVVRMAGVTLGLVVLLLLFYKELLVSSFDRGLAFSLGINAHVMHYSLMAVLSVVVVSAFESVGSILVVAMLIVPGATAALLAQTLPRMLWLTVAHAAISSVGGVHLALYLESSIAAAMVVVGAFLFLLAWCFNPRRGLLTGWMRKHRSSDALPQTAEV